MSMAIPRASASDLEYGATCPTCAGPKTDQALQCAACFHERRRHPDYWEVRTCACGGPKNKWSEKCLRCEHERRQGLDMVGDRRVVATEGHPWSGLRATGRRADMEATPADTDADASSKKDSHV